MYIGASEQGVHPLFAYEMLWNTIGFVLLVLLAKKKKYNGEIFFTYLAWYGLGRAFLELLRDSKYVLSGYVSSIIAATFFVIAATANIILAVRSKKACAAQEYTPQFTQAQEKKGDAEDIKEESEDGKNN